MKTTAKKPETDTLAQFTSRQYKELRKKEREAARMILGSFIDNPFEDVITYAGLRERDIISFVYDRYPKMPEMEDNGNGLVMTIYSSFIGVRQGDVVVTSEGLPIPSRGIEKNVIEYAINYPSRKTREFFEPLCLLSEI